MIKLGNFLSVPSFLSCKSIIKGITTAGETAQITKPSKNDHKKLTFNMNLEQIPIMAASDKHGNKENLIIFHFNILKLFMSRESPARHRIIQNATFLNNIILNLDFFYS